MANSPQVLFFSPIIDELRARGHEVSLTLRDFAQTRELADQHELRYTALGEHGGRNRLRTLSATLKRSYALARWASDRQFELAVSSNVYSHDVACRLMGLRLVNLYDYDPNPANHLAFRLAHRVVVPETFPDEALRRFGVSPGRYAKYAGTKEEVYLSTFVPTP